MTSPIGVLVMAYGGPDRIEDVEPYLLDVRGGRLTPASVLAEVTRRYQRIGGRSPIRERTQAQAAGLQEALDAQGGGFRAIVGMRHWQPRLEDAAAELYAGGIRRLVGLAMAPHYSRLSVELYYDRLLGAVAALAIPPEVARIDSWKNDLGLIEVLTEQIEVGLRKFAGAIRDLVEIVFTAHSLPERILSWNDPYPSELQVTYDLLRARFPGRASHFAYQSAAMTPETWLGPDAGALMEERSKAGVPGFLVVPMGFVCEHVEILYDIDIDYRSRVEAVGGRLERIDMPGADRRLMASLARRVRSEAAAREWL